MENEDTFGHWTVLERLNYRQWLCRCICGTEKLIESWNLKAGKSKSCGCEGLWYYKQYKKERRAWALLRHRCLCETSADYPRYGGRGIRVCDRWSRFDHFFEDMGSAPSRLHTIDRIDVNGDYCKENCRWATAKQQGRNRRNTRYLTIYGSRVSLSEAAETFNIRSSTIRERIRRGWRPEDAVLKKPLGLGERLK